MSQPTMTLLQHAAARGKAWNMPFNAIDPTAADDHFAHFKNAGERSLAMVEIEASSTVAGNLEPFRATGDGANTPTGITPAGLYGSGGAGPVGTFETGVNLALTVGEILGHFYLVADVARLIPVYYVIPPGSALAFNWEISTGILSGHATLIELDVDDDPIK